MKSYGQALTFLRFFLRYNKLAKVKSKPKLRVLGVLIFATKNHKKNKLDLVL